MNVLDVQSDLVAHGYKPGPVDGKLGARTLAALHLFANEHGVEGDDETIALALDTAPAPGGWDLGTISLPIQRRFFKLPRPGSNLAFGADRGIRTSGPMKGSKHHHQGEDYIAPVGTPLYSIANGGIVTHAHDGFGPLRGFGGYGRVVVVHYPGLAFSLKSQPPEVDLALHETGAGDDLYLLHAHCDRVLVRVGEYVSKGQQVATVGKTAFSAADPTNTCGAHTHDELALLPYPKGLDRRKADYGRIQPTAFYRDNGLTA